MDFIKENNKYQIILNGLDELIVVENQVEIINVLIDTLVIVEQEFAKT